jgi:hypothetical protein
MAMTTAKDGGLLLTNAPARVADWVSGVYNITEEDQR